MLCNEKQAMTVYKYVNLDGGIKILSNNSLRFTQPDALNDPFELLPSLSIIKELAYELAILMKRGDRDTLTAEEINQIKQENEDAFKPSRLRNLKLAKLSFLIFCLAKQKDNLLMWSHYADMHRGFVIGFDETSPFFKPGFGKGKDGLRNVIYKSERYKLPCQAISALSPEEQEAAQIGIIFTKGPVWGYEEELRIVAHPASASDNSTFTKNGEQLHLFNFPLECLKEVILGVAMPDDTRKEIMSIVTKKYPNAKLFQAELDADLFALNILPISKS